MKNQRISQCNIEYDSWQMQCCGDPINIGQIVNLPCINGDSYTCSCGIEVNYSEEHHGGGANCLICGKVIKIRSVFVGHFAKSDLQNIDDPNNTFTIIDVENIDGWENPSCYEHRKGSDVCYYIITLENAIKCSLESLDRYPLYQGLYVNMEPDNESKNMFWDEGGSEMGTVNELTIYKKEKSQKINLTTYKWHKDLLVWHRFFQENIGDRYKKIDHLEWLKWWSKGWGLAKEIRKILPEDIELTCGHKSQYDQVIDGSDLNFESFRISFPKHMQNRIAEGLYIPNAYIDWRTDDDKNRNYSFEIDMDEHDFHPDDRVMLGVYGRMQYQTGTVLQCSQNVLLIHTDWPLDISESYSIELIV